MSGELWFHPLCSIKGSILLLCCPHSPQSWQGGMTEGALNTSENIPKNCAQGALTCKRGSRSVQSMSSKGSPAFSPCGRATATRQGDPQVIHS